VRILFGLGAILGGFGVVIDVYVYVYLSE
jgi:hypothetical protein